MNEETVRTYDVRIEIEPEGDLYLAYCPDFDISSFGETFDEAREMILDAVTAFLMSAPEEEANRRYSASRQRRGDLVTERVKVPVGA